MSKKKLNSKWLKIKSKNLVFVFFSIAIVSFLMTFISFVIFLCKDNEFIKIASNNGPDSSSSNSSDLIVFIVMIIFSFILIVSLIILIWWLIRIKLREKNKIKIGLDSEIMEIDGEISHDEVKYV